VKNTALLFALILALAQNASAQSPLIWGQGQWGVNTWSAESGGVTDSDGDGIGNNADTDDDGDGVPDSDDAFPSDATESFDTDGDGLGNNADTDDDNDGYTDQYELEMGSDPLDPSDMPRTGGLSPALLRVISQEVVKDDGG
jgi:hypothetical protein